MYSEPAQSLASLVNSSYGLCNAAIYKARVPQVRPILSHVIREHTQKQSPRISAILRKTCRTNAQRKHTNPGSRNSPGPSTSSAGGALPSGCWGRRLLRPRRNNPPPLYLPIYIYIYIYVYVCMYICVYNIHIYIYIYDVCIVLFD